MLKNSPIEVKQAINIAVQYLKSMFVSVTNVPLEELKLTDDEQFWLITLSYNDSSMEYIFLKNIKIFKIRRDNGEVVAMKIRKV